MNSIYEQFKASALKVKPCAPLRSKMLKGGYYHTWAADHVRDYYMVDSKEFGKLLEQVTNKFTPAMFTATPFQKELFVGLEIELENTGACPRGFKDIDLKFWYDIFWALVADGSLRDGGAEHVSRLGLSYPMVPAALDTLTKVCAENKRTNIVNARTGLHIHIDCTDRTLEQIANILVVYGCLEPFIFAMSGKRTANVFCLPWAENSWQLPDMLNQFLQCSKELKFSPKGDNGLKWELEQLVRGGTKYCALNLNPLVNFGTIEFRHHHGTKDKQEILNWLKLIHDLVLYCSNTTAYDNLMLFRGIQQRPEDLVNAVVRIFGHCPIGLGKELADSTRQFFLGFVDKNKVPKISRKITKPQQLNSQYWADGLARQAAPAPLAPRRVNPNEWRVIYDEALNAAFQVVPARGNHQVRLDAVGLPRDNPEPAPDENAVNRQPGRSPWEQRIWQRNVLDEQQDVRVFEVDWAWIELEYWGYNQRGEAYPDFELLHARYQAERRDARPAVDRVRIR